MDWYLAIDIGTGGVHTAAVDKNLSVSRIEYEKLEYSNPDGKNGREIDTDALFAMIMKLCSKVTEGRKGVQGDCLGIVITGQRHGAIFLDEKGETLLACPNIDGRAVEASKTAGRDHGLKVYAITSRWPAPYFPAMRSLWMKKYRPEQHAHFRYLLMLNEWLGWKLTGVMASEPTNATETLVFNIAEMKWSEELRVLFGMEKVALNPLVASGSAIGRVSEPHAQTLGLPTSVPVILAPSDTQSAAIGCGALSSGDIIVVNGSTTPVVQVIDGFITDNSRKMWITPYIDGKWLIEANANKSGIMYRFLVDSCAGFVSNIMRSMGFEPDSNALKTAIRSMDSQETNAIGYWSPRISDVSNPQMNGCALLTPLEENPYAAVLSSYAENLAFAVQGNIELTTSLSGLRADKIWLTGGGCGNEKFCSLVATLSGQAKVMKTLITETTMRGAVAATMGKTGADIAKLTNTFLDEVDIIAAYENKMRTAQRYKLWREGYDGILEFHHRRNP
jgi:autoinducer 2 (AI-2) kinase